MDNLRLELDSPAYCYLELDERSAIQPLEWERLLHQMEPYILRVILRVQGPYYPGLAERLRPLRKIPFDVEILGCWPDITGLIERLKDSPDFEHLIIPLHGALKESHELFTGRRNFDITVDQIEQAVSYGLTVHSTTVIGKHNRTEIEKLAGFSSDLGTQMQIFNRYIGPLRENISLFRDELRDILEILWKLRKDGYAVLLSGCFPQCFFPSESKCLAGLAFLAIDSMGNVKPCPFSTEIAGSIRRESLEAIWKSALLRAYRNNLFSLCRDCPSLPDCHGGCRAITSLLGLKRDYLIGAFPSSSVNDENMERMRPEWGKTHIIHPRYVARKETFGMILLCNGRVIPVSRRGIPVIRSIEKLPSLKDFRHETGKEGFDFVKTLYNKGFVDISAPCH